MKDIREIITSHTNVHDTHSPMAEITMEVQHPQLPEKPVSFDQFVNWMDEDIRAEWVEGEILLMSPANNWHQNIVRFLTSLLSTYAEHAGIGTVRPSPFLMRLEDRPSGREPDLLFVSNDHEDRLQESYLNGPADLVFEVISPESMSRDRGEKFVEYEAAGIPEYWLVDPLRDELTVYRLKEDGKYRTVFQAETGRAESEVVEGFWIDASWLWDDSMPKILDVLKEWEII